VSHIDPANTHQVKEVEHPTPLLTCQYDSTGRFVFAGAQDNYLQRIDVATGEKILMEGHENKRRKYHFPVDRGCSMVKRQTYESLKYRVMEIWSHQLTTERIYNFKKLNANQQGFLIALLNKRFPPSL
jgi:hypothetical protein